MLDPYLFGVVLRLRPRALVELFMLDFARDPPADDLAADDREDVERGLLPLAATERLRVVVDDFFVPLVALPPVIRDFLAVAAPPFFPPFLAGALFSFFPRPDPERLPPPSLALTVAHARRAASFAPTPRFS
jgi:hypothetical protein